jgi:hypothetical protein
MVEDAEEIKPPVKVERLATDKVEEADNGPETLSWAVIVEEPTEIYPPDKVARLVTNKVFSKTEAPVTFKVEEDRKMPETWRLEEIVEEAEEIKPPRKLANPVWVIVPVAIIFAALKVPENNPFP